MGTLGKGSNRGAEILVRQLGLMEGHTQAASRLCWEAPPLPVAGKPEGSGSSGEFVADHHEGCGHGVAVRVFGADLSVPVLASQSLMMGSGPTVRLICHGLLATVLFPEAIVMSKSRRSLRAFQIRKWASPYDP